MLDYWVALKLQAQHSVAVRAQNTKQAKKIGFQKGRKNGGMKRKLIVRFVESRRRKRRNSRVPKRKDISHSKLF